MSKQQDLLTAISLKKQAVLLFLFLNLAVILYFWSVHNLESLFMGSGQAHIALGLLAGLLAAFTALVQFVVMSRSKWLENLFGLDRMAVFHRFNGFVAIALIIIHPILISNGYAQMAGIDLKQQIVELFQLHPSMKLAFLASALFATVAFTSLYIVRKHIKFEAWFFIHLLVYVAITSAFFHQVLLGSDFLHNDAFRYYWYGLYLFVLINILTSRVGTIAYRFLIHRFEVKTVISETADSTSVYITGRKLNEFQSKAGQFVMVRFLDKDKWWQEHPFSISQARTDGDIRLTIKNLGDFTARIGSITPGTKVLISGPFGIFTSDRSVKKKKLLIAGGIGITPIFAMIDEAAESGRLEGWTLIYANKTEMDIIFKDRLDELAGKGLRVIYLLSRHNSGTGRSGRVDKAAIEEAVDDLKDREIYICGPEGLLRSVLSSLKLLGVDKKQIHYESFSLHKN